MKKFKEWLRLKETSTGTGDVANFARITIGGNNQRMFPEPIIMGDENKKKKTKHFIKKS